MVRGMSIPTALDLYPEMTVTDSKGKTQTERANKYFVMYGETGDVAGVSIDQRRFVCVCVKFVCGGCAVCL